MLQKSLLVSAVMSVLLCSTRTCAQGVQPKNKALKNLQAPRNGSALGSLKWAGTRLSRADAALQIQLGLTDQEGLVVTAVEPGSAADSAGLKAKDVLVRINGKPVPNTLDGFSNLVKEQKIDEGADLDIIRDGKEEMIKSARFPTLVQLNTPSSKRGRGNIKVDVSNVDGTKAVRIQVGDVFSGKYSRGDLKITIRGNLTDDPTVAAIVITQAAETKHYASTRDVPAEYQPIIRQLVPAR